MENEANQAQAAQDVTKPTVTTTEKPTNTQSDGQPLGSTSGHAANADNALSKHKEGEGDAKAKKPKETTRAQVAEYLKKHPEQAAELLADLDESTPAEHEAGQQEFVTTYLAGNDDFAKQTFASLGKRLFPNSEVSHTPADAAATTTKNVPSAAEAFVQSHPDAFYERGQTVQADLGSVKVAGVIHGIYVDGDGLTYQLEVHVKDGVPMLGQSARTVKIDVPADLVSAAE